MSMCRTKLKSHGHYNFNYTTTTTSPGLQQVEEIKNVLQFKKRNSPQTFALSLLLSLLCSKRTPTGILMGILRAFLEDKITYESVLIKLNTKLHNNLHYHWRDL